MFKLDLDADEETVDEAVVDEEVACPPITTVSIANLFEL